MKRGCWLSIAILGLWFGAARGVPAMTITDDFTGSGPDGNKWFLPPHEVHGTGSLAQSNDRLEISASVSPGGSPENSVLLVSKAAGLQNGNWMISLSIHLAEVSTFLGMGNNDAVHGTLEVVTSASGDDDGLEFNFGVIDVSGSGDLDHVIRLGWETNGVKEASLQPLNHAGALTIRVQLDYDKDTKKISASYDTGGGLTYFGSVDTSGWGMAPGSVFIFGLLGGAATLDGNPPTTQFSVEAGDLYFDDFVADGEGITLIPEPSVAGLIGVAAGLSRAFRRQKAPR